MLPTGMFSAALISAYEYGGSAMGMASSCWQRGGQIQLTADILAAVQVVFASLRALHLDRSSGPTAIATEGDGG